MAPLSSIVMSFMGLICLPCAYINGLYLSNLVLVACWLDLSCVNVDLSICMWRLGLGVIMLVCSSSAPMI